MLCKQLQIETGYAVTLFLFLLLVVLHQQPWVNPRCSYPTKPILGHPFWFKMSGIRSSFSRIITSDGDDVSPLDRSRGRVQLIGGDLFYSPNSQRNVHVPPVYNNFPSRDYFTDSFDEFRQPLWWQPASPYLAFVPLRPIFSGVPFQELYHISYFPRRHSGYFAIDTEIVLGWARLEKNIRDAVALLLSHEHAPAITWIVPSSLACTGIFKRVRDLRVSFAHSKDWFSLFMGGLSYAIAVSLSLRQEEDIPHWFSFLYERDYSQIWLSGIRSSIVATFDSSVERVGVFVQLCQRHRDQFSVDWLYSFNIPVWYPWSAREARMSLTDTRLARFAPLPYQLQEGSTFLTTNPSPQPPQPTADPQTGAYDCKLFISHLPPTLYLISSRCLEFHCDPFLESVL